PQDIAIDRRDAMEFVVLAVTPNAFVDFREMRDHSLDEGLSKIANPRCRRAKFPEIVDAFRPLAVLQITPEMILDRSFARLSPFAHKNLFPAKFRYHIGDFHRAARGFGPAVDLIFEAALARLSFVVETKNGVDYRHAMPNRDALQCICDRAAQILRVIGLSFQDDATSDYGIRFFLPRQFAHNDWNFECARHSLDRNTRVRRESTQFLGGMINEALHIRRIKLTGHDDERSRLVTRARTGRDDFRHSTLDSLDLIRRLSPASCRSCNKPKSATPNHSKCPILVRFVSRYFALCGLASLRIGTCSIISRP